MTFLSGKKTYIAALGLLISAIWGPFLALISVVGSIDGGGSITDLIQAFFSPQALEAYAVAGLRLGISSK